MSITFWIISASAGFSLTRHQNFLATVLPSAIGILVIQHYDNGVSGRIWILAFFIFVALFLLGRLNFLQDQKSWRVRRVFLSPENSLDLTSSMAIAAGLIIITAWTIPISISRIDTIQQAWSHITKPWTDFTDRMQNAVSALKSTTGGTSSEFYGTELKLGNGFPLSTGVMFTVEAPELPIDQKPPRYYWRGRTYDYFSAGQWYTTGTARTEFSPGEPGIPVADIANNRPERYAFTTSGSKFSLLYAPPQPIWFSRPGSFLASKANDTLNITSWNATPTLLPGESYQVDAVVKNPNIEELRAAGTQYPQWVIDRYVQMPENFSPRIKALAAEITAQSATPYDKTFAITQYLRTNIKYAPTIPDVPRNSDPLEWILFQYKKAYCVYYATSEVMMLRAIGIPARMAVGVFEPTGNQAPLDRPLAPQGDSGTNTGLNAGNLPKPETDSATPTPDQNNGSKDNTSTNSALFPLLYLLPLLIIFAALTVYLSRRYALMTRVPSLVRTTLERTGIEVPIAVIYWERWSSLSPIERSFESINFGLRQLRQPPPIYATPVERAANLAKILPQLKIEIKVLLDEHQTSLYTSRIADEEQAGRAAFKIRAQVIFAIIRHFWTGNYESTVTPTQT